MNAADQLRRAKRQFSFAIGSAFAICIGLLAFGAVTSDSGRFSYLLWNLLLAALPLLFALQLQRSLRRKLWSDWAPFGWSILWLLFLPNSFYLVSDYIHLREISRADILFNSVLFTAFIFLGVLLGYCGLYVVHRQFRRRFSSMVSNIWVGVTLFICSCAIYIGRDLRWNSWDVLFNPFGLLFDISDRFMRPEAYPQMLITIASFFVLLTSLYAVIYTAVRLCCILVAHETATRSLAHDHHPGPVRGDDPHRPQPPRTPVR